MLIACEVCGVKCPSLTGWNSHLISTTHQTALKTQIILYGSIATGGDGEDGKYTFLLRIPWNKSAASSPVEGIMTRLSHYGFLHNLLVNPSQTLVIVNLELYVGFTETAVTCKLKDFHVVRLVEAFSSVEWKRFFSGDDGFPLEVENVVTENGHMRQMQGVPSKLYEPPERNINLKPPEVTSCLLEAGTPTKTGLKTRSDFDNKLNVFFNQVLLTESDMEMRRNLLKNLEDCLKGAYPDCRFYPFGSFLSGIGDKSSDLDAIMTGHGGIPGVQLVRSLRTILKKVRSPDGRLAYDKIEAILKTTIQVIRFVEVSSGLSCDLSFSNFLALRNSELISFMLKLDERVRGLILLARQWGKVYGLTDSTKLKNYCLVLLVFVFLARKKILPTIHALQDVGEVEEIDGWNAGFCRDVDAAKQMIVQSRNEEESKYALSVTILELTRDFFQMMATESFEGRVICTLTAESFERLPFSANGHEHLPDAYSRLKSRVRESSQEKFKLKPFNVQDPFNLESNLGKSVSKKVFRKLVFTLRETADHLSSLLNNEGGDHEITITSLFPPFIMPPNFTVPGTETDEKFTLPKRYDLPSLKAGCLDRIGLRIKDKVAAERFQGIQTRILEKSKGMEFGLAVEFAEMFFTHDESVLGNPPNEEREEFLFHLWCQFAQQFISRVWNHSYFLQYYENVLLDETGPPGEEEAKVEFPIYVTVLSVFGKMFPPWPLFEARHESGPISELSLDVNPLDKERNVREQCPRGLNCKGRPDFKSEWLMVLEIDEDGPYLALLNYGLEAMDVAKHKQVVKIFDYIIAGMRRVFQQHQMHLLHKWTQSGKTGSSVIRN